MMLEVEGLAAAYGDSRVLHNISFGVGEGEVVTLLCRNCMGKTTTVSAIMGLVKPCGGAVRFRGADITGLPPYRIAAAGIGLVPEGRRAFPALSVEENLVATATSRSGPPRWTLEGIYELFPALAARRRNLGSQLSGGEQQMLVIGRALMTNPKLLILDEATEGLAPLLREEIWACLRTLRSERQAILLIDKNIAALHALADRHVIIEKGVVRWTGSSEALAADPSIAERFLHV